MNAALRDRILGLALLVTALAWSAIVYLTIPAGGGGGAIGPRAFPLFLGAVLAVLSALLFLRSFSAMQGKEPAEQVGDELSGMTGQEVRLAGGVFGLLIVYGVLMEKAGFLLATPPVIAAALAGLLGLRKPVFVAGLALSITASCWIIFGKLLGVYLPRGSWISLELFL